MKINRNHSKSKRRNERGLLDLNDSSDDTSGSLNNSSNGTATTSSLNLNLNLDELDAQPQQQRVVKIRRGANRQRLSARRTDKPYDSRMYFEDLDLPLSQKKVASGSRVSTAVDSEASSSPCDSSPVDNSPTSSDLSKAEFFLREVDAARKSPVWFAFDGVLILLNVYLMLFIVHTVYGLVFSDAPGVNDLVAGVGKLLREAVTGAEAPCTKVLDGGSAVDSIAQCSTGRSGGASGIGLLDFEL